MGPRSPTGAEHLARIRRPPGKFWSPCRYRADPCPSLQQRQRHPLPGWHRGLVRWPGMPVEAPPTTPMPMSLEHGVRQGEHPATQRCLKRSSRWWPEQPWRGRGVLRQKRGITTKMSPTLSSTSSSVANVSLEAFLNSLEDAVGECEKIDFTLELVAVVSDLEHKQLIESQELLNDDELSQIEA